MCLAPPAAEACPTLDLRPLQLVGADPSRFDDADDDEGEDEEHEGQQQQGGPRANGGC